VVMSKSFRRRGRCKSALSVTIPLTRCHRRPRCVPHSTPPPYGVGRAFGARVSIPTGLPGHSHEGQELRLEAPSQERLDHVPRGTVGRREPRQHRIALEQDVGREVDLGRNRLARRVMSLVPGREQGHDETRVDRSPPRSLEGGPHDLVRERGEAHLPGRPRSSPPSPPGTWWSPPARSRSYRHAPGCRGPHHPSAPGAGAGPSESPHDRPHQW